MAVDIPVAGTSDGATGTGDTQLSLAAPSGIANGDLLLQVGVCVDARTLTNTTGLTEIEFLNLNSANNYVWAKKAASESGSYIIDASGSFAAQSAVMLRITGALCDNVATDVLVEEGGNTTNDQTSECPNVTTPVANCMVLWVEIAGNGQTADSIDRGGATEVIDFNGGPAAGDGGHISIWKEMITSAGAVTGAVITRSGFGGNQTFGIVIQPATGGGPDVQQRTIAIAGVAAVNPQSRFRFRSAVSSAGVGALNAQSRFRFRSAMTSAGLGAFSVTSRALFRSVLSVVAGVAVTLNARYLFRSVLSAAGIAAASFGVRYFFRSVLNAVGVGAFNPASTAGNVIQATLSAAGSAASSFVSRFKALESFTSQGSAVSSFLARFKARVSFASQGSSQATFQTESGTPSRIIVGAVDMPDRVLMSEMSDRLLNPTEFSK